MRQYIIRRLFISVIVLLGVSIIIYTVLRSMPADFVDIMTAGQQHVTEATKHRLKVLYGLDKSILEGYVDWISKFIKGDFGESFYFKTSVWDVFVSKLGISFSLNIISFILQLIIAIPLGIISATKQYTRTDNILTSFAMLCISLPSFFFAAVLQKFFAIQLGLVPIQGLVSAKYVDTFTPFQAFADKAWHLILPLIVLTILSIGGWMRYVRTNMLEVLNMEYVKTARAKGLSEHTVIYKHAFDNTKIPLVTMIGGSLPAMFSGAMITESVFKIPGVGYAVLLAIQQSDLPYMMFYFMFMALMTLIGVLISDILYAVVDPRVRLS